MAAAHNDTTTMTTINDFKTVVTEQLEVIVRKIATHIGLGKDEDMKSLQSLVLEHIEETDFEALEKSIKKKKKTKKPRTTRGPIEDNCRCMARVWGYSGQPKGSGEDQCRLRRISNEDYCTRHSRMSKISEEACALQEPPEWSEMTLDEQRSIAETQKIKTIGLRLGRIDEWFMDEGDETKYPPGVDRFGVIRVIWKMPAFLDLCHVKVAAGIWKWEGGKKGGKKKYKTHKKSNPIDHTALEEMLSVEEDNSETSNILDAFAIDNAEAEPLASSGHRVEDNKEDNQEDNQEDNKKISKLKVKPMFRLKTKKTKKTKKKKTQVDADMEAEVDALFVVTPTEDITVKKAIKEAEEAQKTAEEAAQKAAEAAQKAAEEAAQKEAEEAAQKAAEEVAQKAAEAAAQKAVEEEARKAAEEARKAAEDEEETQIEEDARNAAKDAGAEQKETESYEELMNGMMKFEPDSEESESESEEESEDAVEVEEWIHPKTGVLYLRDESGNVYDRVTQDPIGMWNESTETIDVIDDDSDSESESLI